MMIDKIGGTNPLGNVQGTQRNNEAAKYNFGADTVYVSDAAKAMSEKYYIDQISEQTPDVRADRVAAVKEKIKDPSYINNAVLASAADRFMESLGL